MNGGSSKQGTLKRSASYGERSPSARELIKKTLSKDDDGRILKKEPPLRRKKKDREKTSPSSSLDDEDERRDGPSTSSSLSSSNDEIENHGSQMKKRKKEQWKEFILQNKQDEKQNFERDFLLADLNAWLESSSVLPTPRGNPPTKRSSITICEGGSEESEPGSARHQEKKQMRKRASSQRQLHSVAKMPSFKSQGTLRKLKQENGIQMQGEDGQTQGEDGRESTTKKEEDGTGSKRGKGKKIAKEKKKDKGNKEKKSEKKAGSTKIKLLKEKRRSSSVGEMNMVTSIKEMRLRLPVKKSRSNSGSSEVLMMAKQQLQQQQQQSQQVQQQETGKRHSASPRLKSPRTSSPRKTQSPLPSPTKHKSSKNE